MTDITNTSTGPRSVLERYVACVGVFTVRDGKIQAVREYVDTAYATRMLFGDREAA